MAKSSKTKAQDNLEIQHINVNKRNWNSYIKEFLMLFLAIVLVFFVENLRESYVEAKSADVLAQSM